MNGTSWSPLQGTTTLLQTRAAAQNRSVYGAEGGSLQPGGQFMVTEDSVQVVDLLISNLDNGDHPFHLHGHRPWIMGTGTGRYIGQASERNEPTSAQHLPRPGVQLDGHPLHHGQPGALGVPLLPGMAHGGGAADADQQPASHYLAVHGDSGRKRVTSLMVMGRFAKVWREKMYE